MKIAKTVMVLALAGICGTASACCGPDATAGVKIGHYKARTPDCNLEKKVIVIKPPPPSVTVKYICGKCEREFNYSKETPYCTVCAVLPVKKVIVMPPEPEPEIVYVRPPPTQQPQCQTPQAVFVPQRGRIFMEDPLPPVIYYQPAPRYYYEYRHDSHTSERRWSQ